MSTSYAAEFTMSAKVPNVIAMAKSKEKKIPVGLRLEPTLLDDLDAAMARVFGAAANRSWAINAAIRSFIEKLDSMASTIHAAESKAATEKADVKKRK